MNVPALCNLLSSMATYQSRYAHTQPGKPVSHAFAKELLVGFVGGEVDKLAETKGMDEYDKVQAHRHAKQSAERMYDDHYVQDQGADQYNPNQYGPPGRLQGRGDGW
jgi:hypothetical protein